MFKFKDNNKTNDLLEVDEVFFDQHQIRHQDLKWQDRLEKPIAPAAVRTMWYLVLASLLFFAVKSGYLVLAQGSYYASKARANYVKEIWASSPRGLIYDSNLKPLIKNLSTFDLVIIPAELPRDRAGQTKIVQALAQILNKSEADIIAQFNNIERFSWRPVPVLEYLSRDELLNLKSKINSLPGLRLEESFRRDYFKPSVFSHVVGYTGRVSRQDIERNPNFLLTDIVGKDGLEASYDKVLRGERGVIMLEASATGEGRGAISSTESRAGDGIVLFLNAALQEKLTQALGDSLVSLGLASGAAVAVDPKSGGILALQSFPLFDNNVFSARPDAAALERVLQDKNKPLFNRAVSGLYPPGSTIKPFIAAAALMEGVIDERRQIFVTGSISVAGQEFKDWKPHGWVDIRKAIAVSSNVFFYIIGGGYGDIEGLGPVNIHDYLERFGFGKLSQIDLAGEQAGFLPTPQWKRQAKNESWFIGDSYNISIGQGDILATPLQMSLATGAIANGGFLLKPRMVKQIIDGSGNLLVSIDPEILNKNFVDSAALKVVQEGMRQTITEGSARSLGVNLSVSAAGKTGTAQTGIGGNTHAWFTVFAPYENPQIVLTVLVENGGEGTAAAVPIAEDILKWYFSRNQ